MSDALEWICLAISLLRDLCPYNTLCINAAVLGDVLLERARESAADPINRAREITVFDMSSQRTIDMASTALSASPVSLPNLLSIVSGLALNDETWSTRSAGVFDSSFPGLEALCTAPSVPALQTFLNSCVGR